MSKPGQKRKLSSDESEECSSDNEDVIYIEEEDSESEPELDCDYWDIDCKIISTQKSNLTGYHLMPTCSNDPDITSAHKKPKIAPELHHELLQTDFIDKFQDNWKNNKRHKDSNAEIITDPFKLCIFNNFLENPELLVKVRQEFDEIKWNTRNMDLYEFFQSEDLKHLTDYHYISVIYDFLRDSVMKYISQLTGIDFTHISATCSFYSNTDYLLVHDDQREDRSVAFVLYFLNDTWSSDKGGALDMLSKDSNGNPDKIARSICPRNNQFVIFPVTNDSYHQVEEITSLQDIRFSINGWFHVKTPPIYTTPQFKAIPESIFSDNYIAPIDFDLDLKSWINGDYLSCNIAKEVQEYFEENSEICLKQFLQLQCYEEIKQILYSDELKFIKIGPPNRFNYEILQISNLPVTLKRFLKMFQSKQFFQLLYKLTDLELKSVKFELQKLTPGCYSLLSDYDWQSKKELDLVINIGCNNNSDIIGARTQYVATDEEIQSALITIEPEENNLNLIYRDTARFTKYYSKMSKCKCSFTLICSYSE